MKYRTNLEMKVAVEHFPGLKLKDLVVFEWIKDFSHTGEMDTKYLDGKLYYWIHYPTIIRELPLLEWKTEDPVYRSMKKMAKMGIFIPHPDNVSDSKSYYAFGPKYRLFIFDDPGQKTGLTPVKKPASPRSKNRADYYTIYKSIIDKKGLSLNSDLEKAMELISKKKKPKLLESVIDIVNYFTKVTGKKIGYGTKSHLSYILKRLEEGHILTAFEMVIDYKFWYFTEVIPNKDNINLDTFLRDGKFDGNLEKAREWFSKKPLDEKDWRESENKSFVEFMTWYWKSVTLRKWKFSQSDFENFLEAKVNCPFLKEKPHKTTRLLVLKRTIDNLLESKKELMENPNGTSLIDVIVKHINEAVKSKS